MTTVKDIIKALSKYNPDAKVTVNTTGYPKPFSIIYGGYEGVAMKSAETVSFYVKNSDTNEDS